MTSNFKIDHFYKMGHKSAANAVTAVTTVTALKAVVAVTAVGGVKAADRRVGSWRLPESKRDKAGRIFDCSSPEISW